MYWGMHFQILFFCMECLYALMNVGYLHTPLPPNIVTNGVEKGGHWPL